MTFATHSGWNGVRLVYLVHNLNDPAVAKRVDMLNVAGIETLLVGFWRGTPPEPVIAGARTIALDQTFDAKLLHRARCSLTNAFLSRRLLAASEGADLVMARNLETLLIGSAISRHWRAPLVYEVLDIHRLMLAQGMLGAAMRGIERRLMREVALLLVSSPAFLTEYFEPFQFGDRRPVAALLENKTLTQAPVSLAAEPECGPPWRIGWLGMLRCRKSLSMLTRLAARRPDLLRVEIHGRPTDEVEQDLRAGLPPSVHFGGAYQPSDLPRLYREMHFSWAIDYFEEGANSRWLLPNRIYEGGCHNVVSLAASGTQTAAWLKQLGIGAVLDDPERDLEHFLERLTPDAYRKLKAASVAAPRSAFAAGPEDCLRLGRLLRAAVQGADMPLSARMAAQ